MSKKSTSYLVASLLGLLLVAVTTWTTAARAATPHKPETSPSATRNGNSSGPASTPMTGCLPVWQQADVLSSPESPGVLFDVDAVSADDVWTVGNLWGNNGPKFRIHHWDGAQWSFSGEDVAAGLPGELEGIAAIAPDDVWAAGTLYYNGYMGTRVALLLHWDGTEWNSVQAPLPSGTTSSGLMHITALSATDIWAVGYANTGQVGRALSLHWDGTQWKVVDVPGAEGKVLKAVSVRAHDDAWAVGHLISSGGALTMHWDGTQWEEVALPNIGAVSSSLDGVAVAGTDGAWAVGHYTPASSPNGLAQPWMVRWDGQSWHNTTDLDDDEPGSLYDVVALSPDDVWAAGVASTWPPAGPLLMHWDGTDWTRTAGPSDIKQVGGIMALAALPSQEIWGSGWLKSEDLSTLVPLVVRTSAPPCNLPTETPAGTATPTATPSSSPTTDPCAPSLQQVDTPNNPPLESDFYDVEPLAPDDVWAAGHAFARYGVGGNQATIERFDGSQWSVVYESPPTGTYTVIRGIEVLAPDDVWAAGFRVGDKGYPLVHWDGYTWTEHSYASRTTEDSLYSIYAVSADDIWAAGTRRSKALTVHWDGTGWTEVPMPEIPGTLYSQNRLYGLSGTATDDVWVVGELSWQDVNRTSHTDVLIAHWDGNAWSVTGLPPVGDDKPKYARLNSISALSRDDVWAVGLYGSHFGVEKPVVMHWDGLAWSRVAVPRPPYADLSGLWDVAALAEDEVWAVGASNGGKSIRDEQAYAVHWDGAKWEMLATRRPQNEQSNLNSVAAVEGVPGEIWMVGRRGTDSTPQTLALRFSSSCDTEAATATPSPSPSPTDTSTATLTPTTTAIATSTPTATLGGTDTATATPATPTATATTTVTNAATATATTTACSLHFADLPQGSTFQPFARCLACKGVLSGYDCGGPGEPCDGQNSPYFRPGKLVTRGQVAKIVANASGLAGAPGAQLFEDVPPGSTFYSYVNRLASLGVMGGYPCGTAGEPCHAGSLPYFRPNATATRGHIAKIVSNGVGYDEEHTGQTFEDVPTTHTFYLPVERLASRSVMGGYDCNGPGEPCGPGTLPYFRPNTHATRGHVAKIVANTFFEECAAP